MSDEEHLSGELQQTVRMLVTVGGQVGERIARLQSDRARQEQLEAQERARAAASALREQDQAARQLQAQQRQDLQRQMQQEVTAARSVYSGVRDGQFWRGDDARLQIRVGEALAVSEAMRPHDKLASVAHDYLRREIQHRHGDDAQAWTVAALAAYRDELASLVDRDTARTDADRLDAAARDGVGSGEALSREESAGSDERTVELALDEASAAEHDADERGRDADQARVRGEVAEHEASSDGVARKINLAGDPEAWRAAETAEQAYPIPAQDTLASAGRKPQRAARQAKRAPARDAARGR